MAVQGAVYRCPRCGQEVRVSVEGLGALVCCNLPMEQHQAPGRDAGKDVEAGESGLSRPAGEVYDAPR